MSEMYIYVCPQAAIVYILLQCTRILLIYLFSNFCHNKTNIHYYIISYYILHPIIYNACLFSYILKYSMFTFHFPPFSPFVCPTRSDKNMINQEVGVAYGKVYTDMTQKSINRIHCYHVYLNIQLGGEKRRWYGTNRMARLFNLYYPDTRFLSFERHQNDVVNWKVNT